MTVYKVKANVRRCGAIGVFYEVTFRVRAAEDADREAVLAAWQEDNSETWELGNVIVWGKEDLANGF